MQTSGIEYIVMDAKMHCVKLVQFRADQSLLSLAHTCQFLPTLTSAAQPSYKTKHNMQKRHIVCLNTCKIHVFLLLTDR